MALNPSFPRKREARDAEHPILENQALGLRLHQKSRGGRGIVLSLPYAYIAARFRLMFKDADVGVRGNHGASHRQTRVPR
jgi:hypothetical protein